MKTEKILVDLGIGEVVTRNVTQRAQAFKDVVGVWVLDNILRHGLFISKVAFLVEKRGQIAVDHFGMIPNSNLKLDNSIVDS